jgi:hypothetical protein
VAVVLNLLVGCAMRPLQVWGLRSLFSAADPNLIRFDQK